MHLIVNPTGGLLRIATAQRIVGRTTERVIFLGGESARITICDDYCAFQGLNTAPKRICFFVVIIIMGISRGAVIDDILCLVIVI